MKTIFEVLFSEDHIEIQNLLQEALTSHGADAAGEHWKEGFSSLTPECINLLAGHRGNCRAFVAMPAHSIPVYDSSLYSEGDSYAFFSASLKNLSEKVSGVISYIGPDFVKEFQNGEQITELSFRDVDNAMSRHSNDEEGVDEYAYLREIWLVRGQPWSPGNLANQYYASDFAGLLYASVRRHRESFGELECSNLAFSLYLTSHTLSLEDYPNLVDLLERVRRSKETFTVDSFGSFSTTPRNSRTDELITKLSAAPELKTAIDRRSKLTMNTDRSLSDLSDENLSRELRTFVDVLNLSDRPVTLGSFLLAKPTVMDGRVGRNPRTGEKVIVPPKRVLLFRLHRPFPEV
jgi:nucleoid DNA-binding protein